MAQGNTGSKSDNIVSVDITMIVIGKQPYFSQTCKNGQMLFLIGLRWYLAWVMMLRYV